jgi:hypothetical protein
MASVAEIDGLRITPPGINPDAATSGLLFTYSGASVAFSVRQLNNNADYVMRVRRVTGLGNTGNDDEADVKFDTTLTDPTISLDSPVNNFSAGGSNATTLGEFLNVGTVGGTTYSDADSLFPNTAEAYATTWYDLTGNQNHAEQTAPQLQPQIHSGTVDTDLNTENGKPELVCEADRFDLTSSITPSAYSAIHVSQQSGRDSASFGRSTIFNYSALYQNSNTWFYHVTAGRTVSFIVPLDTQQLHWLNWSGTTVGIGVDGGTFTTGSLSALPEINTLLYATGATQSGWRGGVQEMIFWPNDEDNAGNRTGIETNINDYYEIVFNDEAATSGFLFDYPNAAAAYSVRQLNNNAEFAMQVERSDGRTKNIGFDGNGDLDTQAIIDFAGASVATIRTWYDQSGAQNHATQITPNLQPQIYNGTAVITENGKPAVDFDGSNDNFRVDFSSIAQPCTYFATCTNDKTVFNYSVLFSSNGNSAARQSAEFTATTGRIRMFAGSALTSVPTVGTSQRLLTYVVDSTNSEIWADASSIVSGNAGTYEQDGLTIGSDWNALGGFWLGTTQELILYPSNQDTAGNRTGIESDINGYFSIF